LNKYETIFVIDSLLKAEEIEANIAKFERFISDNGGNIEIIDQWGKKRMAYEIKKRQYGIYVLIRFDAPGTIVKPLEREYRLNESILRYKVLKLETQALKALAKASVAQEKAAQKIEPPEGNVANSAVQTAVTENKPETDAPATAEPTVEPTVEEPTVEPTVEEPADGSPATTDSKE